MAVSIKFDPLNNAIQPTLILATRSGNKMGILPATGIHLNDHMTTCAELQFAVHRDMDGVRCQLWDDIQDFKLVWSPEWDIWFEINVELNEQDDTVKNISAKELGEAELSQINLYGIEINTENDIARDDYEPTVIYDQNHPGASLLNRILEKAPHYTIDHVDATLASIQRTFQFDGTNIMDALNQVAQEIDCYVKIDSGSNGDGTIARKISLYDLCTCCNTCGERGRFSGTCPECGGTDLTYGYGDDTRIFVSVENLADNVTYSADAGSVKNCFRLVAGDDLMTATIRNCNPSGSDYIWYIPSSMRSDMSSALQSKLSQYDTQYNYYNRDAQITLDSSMVSAYNTLVTKYNGSPYNQQLTAITNPVVGFANLISAYYDTIDFEQLLTSGLMPTPSMSQTDAATEAAKLTSAALSPVSVTNTSSLSTATASNAVLSMAKVIVNPRFQVKVKTGSLSGTTWSGSFTVTDYSNEEDTADSSSVSVTINDDYENFVHQKLSKAMSDRSDEVTDISSLFELSLANFRNEIKKYSLHMLTDFNDACLACMNIMIEQGIASADDAPYYTMYEPYYNKQLALMMEIKTREGEIATVAGTTDENGMVLTDGMKSLIVKQIKTIQSTLNFETYVGTTLMKELAAFRREDTYENSNYISDGLNNAEVVANAIEFLKVARQELYKSAMLQHSISSSLKNLLVMREFRTLVDYFNIGNWLRVRVDENVYRLRLIGYEIDFDNLDSLSVEFSDVEQTADGVTDIESILSKAASMATSYGTVARQSNSGYTAKAWLEDWVGRGLSLTQMKILDDAQDQNIQIDELGLLCRQYSSIMNGYDDKQLRIINRGLYLTDDNWQTSKAGIGDFYYYDPSDGQTKEAYGVIADTLVGNLILSSNVGVYNETGTVKLDKNGLTIISNGTGSGANDVIFRVQRRTSSGGTTTDTDVIYFDNNGNAHFSGSLDAASGTFYGDVTSYSVSGNERLTITTGGLFFDAKRASASASSVEWRPVLRIFEDNLQSSEVENMATKFESSGRILMNSGEYTRIEANTNDSSATAYLLVYDGVDIVSHTLDTMTQSSFVSVTPLELRIVSADRSGQSTKEARIDFSGTNGTLELSATGAMTLTSSNITSSSNNLTVKSSGDTYVCASNTTTGCKVFLDSGSGSNHGLYSHGYYTVNSQQEPVFISDPKWMIYRNGSGNIVVDGFTVTDQTEHTGQLIGLTKTVGQAGNISEVSYCFVIADDGIFLWNNNTGTRVWGISAQ